MIYEVKNKSKKILWKTTEIQRVQWYIRPKKWQQLATYYWARIDSGIRGYGEVIKKDMIKQAAIKENEK